MTGIPAAAHTHWGEYPRRPGRPLPRGVHPVQNETLDSYLFRLAAANAITRQHLLLHLQAKLTPKIIQVDLECLARVSRQPPQNLAWALPQLRDQCSAVGESPGFYGQVIPAHPNRVRPACPKCSAAKSITETVWIWTRHDQNICLRHGLWIGGGVREPQDQIDLTGHPDILRAQQRHNRLLRRHDHRLVRTVYQLARELLDDITHRGYELPYLESRNLRETAGLHDRPWIISHNDPVHHAVNYPEAVTLTELLTSPHWRSFALSRSYTDQERFHHEFWRRLPSGYPLHDGKPGAPNFRVTILCTPVSDWTAHLAPSETHQPLNCTGQTPEQTPHRPSHLQRHSYRPLMW